MKLKHLLNSLKSYKAYGNVDRVVTSIADDSRKVKKGSLFIAIRGESVDGHDYIKNAVRNGVETVIGEKERDKISITGEITYIRVGNSRKALALVASAWNDYPSKYLKIIGVTGTDGKTTTANLIYHYLSKLGKNTGLISTISAVIAGKEIDTGFHVTNPEPIDLHKYLRKMVNARCEYAVLEVTSHGLHQGRVAGIDFEIAVMTNITYEHMDYHKSWKEYRSVKSELFKKAKIAVLNKDDKSFKFIKEKLTQGTRLLSYSIKDKKADINASEINSIGEKTKFKVVYNNKSFNSQLNLLGNYNVLNYLGAVGAGIGAGFEIDDIFESLSDFKTLKGRLEAIDNDRGLKIYIDFAHTPNSLESVLKVLRSKGVGKLISIFGCAGERDRDKRGIMGEISAKYADISVITAEDPRSEDVNNILTEITKGVKKVGVKEIGKDDNIPSKGKYFMKIPERGEAISFAINELAQKGDTVVICGKGHEKSMAYNGKEYPWSDHEAVRLALKGKTLNISR